MSWLINLFDGFFTKLLRIGVNCNDIHHTSNAKTFSEQYDNVVFDHYCNDTFFHLWQTGKLYDLYKVLCIFALIIILLFAIAIIVFIVGFIVYFIRKVTFIKLCKNPPNTQKKFFYKVSNIFKVIFTHKNNNTHKHKSRHFPIKYAYKVDGTIFFCKNFINYNQNGVCPHIIFHKQNPQNNNSQNPHCKTFRFCNNRQKHHNKKSHYCNNRHKQINNGFYIFNIRRRHTHTNLTSKLKTER